ncbi:MAG: GNAT family N-acetyltransferase [Jatrophihabitans sp.]|uniref:GNAT family N-acetyltransferase n=1 Tax=Jatrophihabitans sp. TaxID=1932789 RepID=UPI003F7D51D0
MLEPQIRRATDDDAATVARIHLESRDASDMPPGIHPPDDVLRHVREVVLPQREVWLARRDGRDVGLLVLDGDHLDWLFVLPADQGRGIGSALIDHAKSQRPGGLELWVFVVNERARRCYERHGFVVVGGTDGDNEEGEPDLLMRWRPLDR